MLDTPNLVITFSLTEKDIEKVQVILYSHK
jgi:hypothetical protein